MSKARASKRPLRADAAQNQARILKAAREIFRERGLGASLDHVADHAGVGVATLYRRFPTRESLVVAMFEQEIDKASELTRIALAAADPWEGLTTLLQSMFQMIATDKGMRQALLSSRYGLSAASKGRGELISRLSQLIKRAQAQGRLRREITAQDIPPMMLMIGAVADFSQKANPLLWRRYSALLIDGLRTGSELSKVSPAALSETDMALAMSQW